MKIKKQTLHWKLLYNMKKTNDIAYIFSFYEKYNKIKRVQFFARPLWESKLSSLFKKGSMEAVSLYGSSYRDSVLKV
jgi:hypothetical protein